MVVWRRQLARRFRVPLVAQVALAGQHRHCRMPEADQQAHHDQAPPPAPLRRVASHVTRYCAVGVTVQRVYTYTTHPPDTPKN